MELATDLAWVCSPSAGGGFWDRVLATIPAAIIASATAMSASWATHFFAAKRNARNIRVGLRTEISFLRREIERCIALPTAKAFVECRILENGKDSCPVFFSGVSTVALLKTEEGEAVHRFYAEFLTIPPIESGSASRSSYNKSDLRTLSIAASNAADIIGGK